MFYYYFEFYFSKLCSFHNFLNNIPPPRLSSRYGENRFSGVLVDSVSGANIENLKRGLSQGALSVRLPVPLPFWDSFSLLERLKEEKGGGGGATGKIVAMGKVMGLLGEVVEDVGVRRRVLVLMQQLGYIIFVESEVERGGGGGKKGVEYVVLDPQWLADVFSTVVTVRHSYVKNGMLNRGWLLFLLKTSPFTFLVFFSFLLSFSHSFSSRWPCSHLERLPSTPPPHPFPPP